MVILATRKVLRNGNTKSVDELGINCIKLNENTFRWIRTERYILQNNTFAAGVLLSSFLLLSLFGYKCQI